MKESAYLSSYTKFVKFGYDDERRVPYITSVEEIGFERGIQEERRSHVVLFLQQRIGQLPDGIHDRILQLNLTQLEALTIAFLNSSTMAELEAWLERLQGGGL